VFNESYSLHSSSYIFRIIKQGWISGTVLTAPMEEKCKPNLGGKSDGRRPLGNAKPR
jgi:hypothetical protein